MLGLFHHHKLLSRLEQMQRYTGILYVPSVLYTVQVLYCTVCLVSGPVTVDANKSRMNTIAPAPFFCGDSDYFLGTVGSFGIITEL